MTPRPAVTWKLRIRTAPIALAALAAVAFAHDGTDGGGILGGGIVIDLGDDPGYWPDWSDPWFSDGAPTGGVVWQDTSGIGADELASSYGFEVSDLYGGICLAESGTENSYESYFNALCLVDAINGSDPYSDAEPDLYVDPPEGSQLNGAILGSEFGRRQFNRQPALTAIRARAAHRLATGDATVVAVLDTGVDATHPMLAGHVLEGPDFVGGDDDASEGLPDGVDQDFDGASDDGYGHGTTVAGLVLAAAPDARILRVRVLDEEAVGTSARVAAAIRWAIDHDADVINLSLGGGYSLAMDQAVDDALAAGVVVVAAAGNSDEVRDFPATKDGVLAVAPNASSGGAVVAPSRGVAGPYPGERWYRGTGTSFGTALVSGGVALAVGRHPGTDAADVRSALGATGGKSAVRLDLVRLAR